MSVYKDPNTLKWDTTAIGGCVQVQINEGGTPETSTADDGTFTHFVRHTPTTFTITLNDQSEARKIANKTTATKHITFKVDDEADADAGTVTLTNAKTGGVSGGYANGAETWTVSGVCDSASDPTA